MKGIISSSADVAASALPGLTDPASLARLEEVARIIDPDAFGFDMRLPGPEDEKAFVQELRDDALAKAEAILSPFFAERRAMVEASQALAAHLRTMMALVRVKFGNLDAAVNVALAEAEAALSSGSIRSLDGGEVQS